MITYHCCCGARLFFDSTCCVACGKSVGWCDACRRITALELNRLGGERSCHGCGAPAYDCANRQQHGACNAFVPEPGAMCRSCRTTTLAPDLGCEENRRRWARLEDAKRRLIYDLDHCGFAWEKTNPPLTFRFPADANGVHHNTGHQDGVVTINLAEADPVFRETVRQQFAEPQRTLIGHLRHEASHYLWQTFVGGQREEAFKQLFGDHNNPPYGEALAAYHAATEEPSWQGQYISRYASSHPWEDFAETAAFYLDMRSLLDTAWHNEMIAGARSGDFDLMLDHFERLGITLNEINRSLGLTDAVPETVPPPVVEKLRFVHCLANG